MTEGFLLQSFFQSAAGVGITENFYCEKTLGGDFAGKALVTIPKSFHIHEDVEVEDGTVNQGAIVTRCG